MAAECPVESDCLGPRRKDLSREQNNGRYLPGEKMARKERMKTARLHGDNRAQFGKKQWRKTTEKEILFNRSSKRKAYRRDTGRPDPKVRGGKNSSRKEGVKGFYLRGRGSIENSRKDPLIQRFKQNGIEAQEKSKLRAA